MRGAQVLNPQLICLRHIHYLPGAINPIHRHEFQQISYVLSGRGIIILDDRVYEITAGQVHIYQPGHYHSIRPQPHCNLETLDLRYILPDATGLASKMPPFIRENTDHILQLLLAIEREGVTRRDLYWQDMAHAHLNELLVTLLRHPQSKTDVRTELVQQALSIIHNSLPYGITVGQLCRELCVNTTHFNSVFRAHLGRSPEAYITEVRVEQAKHLLLTNPHRYTIQSIAKQLGWRDTRHFRQIFRRVTGMPPTEYARTHYGHFRCPYSVESYVLFNDQYQMRWESQPMPSIKSPPPSVCSASG
jgi:AraC-like DNA-binding protein